MPYPYTPPDFLQNQSVDEIHQRMMDALPPDIDKSEAQIPWDFTRPAAIEKSGFIQFELNETIKIMFPHWAYGNWLDMHAQTQGLTRRPANKAFGYLTVLGKPGLVINKGFQFATAANLTPSVIFESAGEVTFNGPPDALGQVEKSVAVTALESGPQSNAAPDTVKLMVKPDTQISYVSNRDAITGGVVGELDDSLRERVLEAIRYGISYAGRDADYVRWAKEVPGVGHVMVEPEWDDPDLPPEWHWSGINGERHCAGAVRIFIVDANGVPANQQILDSVYQHIIRDDDRMERLAPIEARLTVKAPSPIKIDVTAAVSLNANEDIDIVTERYKKNLDKYWLTAATEYALRDIHPGVTENTVRYVYIGAALAETEGVYDYDHASLLVNGAMDNILIGAGSFPVTGEVKLIA